MQKKDPAVGDVFLLWLPRSDCLHFLLAETDLRLARVLCQPLLLDVETEILYRLLPAEALEAIENKEQRLAILSGLGVKKNLARLDDDD